MRGRIAKALRRLARERTVGLPERQLVEHPRPSGHQLENRLQTTRGLTRHFKSQYKRGLLGGRN